MNFDLYKHELARKVTRHLGEKKNVLEVILTSQLVTRKSKCLAINDGTKQVYIYTQGNHLLSLRNSEGDQDLEALNNLDLDILSFEEHPWSDDKGLSKSSLELDDVFDEFANLYCQKKLTGRKTKAACYLDKEGIVKAFNSELPVPEKRIISYVMNFSRIFDLESSKTVKFKFKLAQKTFKEVSVSSESERYLIETQMVKN